MKQELYHYTAYLKEKHLEKAPMVWMWIILSIFLLPTILVKIWMGIGIFCVYLILYFCTRKEADKHIYALTNFWLFVLFLGIDFSALLMIEYNVFYTLLITVLVLIVSYEILWLINLHRKAYSRKAKPNKILTSVMTPICGFVGVLLGKAIAKFENKDFVVWVAIIISAILIVGAITFFQKYLIYKVVEK